MHFLTSSLAFCLTATLPQGPDLSQDARDLGRDLRQGRAARALAHAAVDPLAFDTALRSVLEDSAIPKARKLALAEEVLASSPIQAPRIFSDGRTPSGWDMVYRTVLTSEEVPPPCAETLRAIAHDLAPDVWKVESALERLTALAERLSDEPACHGLFAAMVGQAVERLVPFPEHHDAVHALLARSEWSRDPRLAWARIRFDQVRSPEQLTAAGEAAWTLAVKGAPPSMVPLTRVGSLRDRVLRGTDVQRDRALTEWTSLITSASDPERDLLYPLGIRYLTRTGEVERALAHARRWLSDGRGSDEACASILWIAGQMARARPIDPEGEKGVLRQLGQHVNTVLQSTSNPALRTEAHWILAGLENVLRADDTRVDHLLVEASTYARQHPVRQAATYDGRVAHWQILDPPFTAEIDQETASRQAAWVLSQRYLERGEWAQALRYLEVIPPGAWCGTAQRERMDLREVDLARCEYHLGREDRARERLQMLLQTSASGPTASCAIPPLIDFAVESGKTDALRAWLTRSALAQESRKKALTYLDYALARHRDEQATARALELQIRATWPRDPHLLKALQGK